VQVLDQQHQRPAPGLRQQEPAQRVERAAPDGRRVERGQRWITGGQAERVPEVERQRHVELERFHPQLDLGRRRVGRLVDRDPAGVAHQLEQRQVGDPRPVRQAAALEHGRVGLGQPAQLVRQPGLAQAGFPGQADQLALTVQNDLQRLPQLGQLTVPPGERAQLVAGGDGGGTGAQAGHAQRVDRALFDLNRRHLLEREVAAHQVGGLLAQQHRARLGRGLQPGRQDGGVPERGVVDPEVVTDRPDHDQAAVDPDPDIHLGPRGDAEGGQDRAPRVILVRDGRPEQRHEPVAEELVDRALIAVHLAQRAPEEPVDDQVKLLRAQLRRQGARPHDVAEQHAHVLALTFDGAAHGQNLLADVPRGVARRGGRARRRAHRVPASGAEPGARRQRRAAGGARHLQLRAALRAEACLIRVVVPAPRAPHGDPPPDRPALASPVAYPPERPTRHSAARALGSRPAARSFETLTAPGHRLNGRQAKSVMTVP
jgi:hypothetical protein